MGDKTEEIGADRPPDASTLYWVAGHLYADAARAQAQRSLMASGSDRMRVDAHSNALLGAVDALVRIAKDVDSGEWATRMREVECAQEDQEPAGATAGTHEDTDSSEPGNPARNTN